MSIPPAVGLDVGNNKCVIAISNNGVVDAVLNEEDSKRETPAAVHFAGEQRLFGSAAASLATTNPDSTITQLKRLVTGRTHLLPYETSPGAADGDVTVKVPYLNNDEGGRVFTSVEMLAMLLGHLKRMTVGSMASTCVIGVPAYFDVRQRRAYSDAAEIARWDPLELLDEGRAIALDYASSRLLPAKVARNVAFVDIGHCDTQVTVVRFEGSGQQTVLGGASDPDLGGRNFDEVMFECFVGRFKERYGIDVCSDAKAEARLRAASEKAKKVLCTNREPSVAVDCLVGGRDVSGVISREEFEALSSELVDRIRGTCRGALEGAGLTKDEVDAVELVGSGSRIPKISEDLAEFFGKNLSRTLNRSECIARGCAIRCEKLIWENRQPIHLLEDPQEGRKEDEKDEEIQGSYPRTTKYPRPPQTSLAREGVKGERVVRFVPTAHLYKDEVDDNFGNIDWGKPQNSRLQASSSTSVEVSIGKPEDEISQTNDNHGQPPLSRGSNKYHGSSHVQSSHERGKGKEIQGSCCLGASTSWAGVEVKGERTAQSVPTMQLYKDKVHDNINIDREKPAPNTSHSHRPPRPKGRFSKYGAPSHVQTSSKREKERGKFSCLPIFHKRNDRVRSENRQQDISGDSSQTLARLFRAMDDATKKEAVATEEKIKQDSQPRHFKRSLSASFRDSIQPLWFLKFLPKRTG